MGKSLHTTFRLFLFLPNSLSDSSFPRILNQGENVCMKIPEYPPQNTPESHSWNQSTSQISICVYTHTMSVWRLLVTLTLFSMRTKSLKIQFHGSPTLVTVTFTNLQSHTASVTSYRLCKFVFVHQNLRDYKLILPFKADSLAKPFLPSAARCSFVLSNFISLISAETLNQKLIFWSELQFRKRKGESGLGNLDLLQL